MHSSKYLFSFILILFISTGSYAKLIVEAPNDSDEVFRIAEEMPSFPGGDREMMSFLKHNIVYPDSALNAGIQGAVFVTFMVEKDGHLGDIYVIRGANKFLDAEALRVMHLMPAWIPGKINGKNVRVQINLPIKFSLK